MEVVAKYDSKKHLKRCSLALLCAVIAASIFPPELDAQTRMLKSGAQTFDIHSTRCVGATFHQANGAIEIALIGDKIFLELNDGSTLDLTIHGGRDPYATLASYAVCTNVNIMSSMMSDFQKQKQIIGQANLTLKINANNTCEILTKTLYVPSCEAYSTGTPVPPRVREFLDQIKSAVAAIPAKHLRMPVPNVRAQTMEIVIGRDPEVFPRYATPFDGMIRRDANGQITQVRPLVRDFDVEK